jgi:Ca2+/H+ antiporter
LETSVWKRKINILLLGIPLVLFREHIPLGELEGYRTIFVFFLSALSLIPLAGFLESAVEELAELLGDIIGGLLHTTATNVAELTLSLFILLAFTAHAEGGTSGAEVVEGTIAGVIIRNSLLFLGLATFLGCWRNGRMRFSRDIATDFSTVFALAVTGLSLPTLAALIQAGQGGQEGQVGEEAAGPGLPIFGHFVPFSLLLAGVLLLSYLSFIVFSVFRFRDGENLQERARLKKALRRQRSGRAGEAAEAALSLPAQPDVQALFSEERASAEARLSGVYAKPEERRRHGRDRMREERQRAREERGESGFLARQPFLRGLVAALILAVATGGVALMSEGFADSVKELLEANTNLEPYEFFLGLILIPLLAGIVELYGSVGMARRKRMDITMEITAGATIQMILLVVPILVIVGALTGHPIDLVFKPLEIIVFGAATFTFMLLSRDGESTILEGVQLCTLWLLFAVAAFFLPPPL